MPYTPRFSVQVTSSENGILSVRPTAFQVDAYVSDKTSVRAFLESQSEKTALVYILETWHELVGHQPLIYTGFSGNIARRGTEYQLGTPESEVQRLIVIKARENLLTECEGKYFEQVLYDAIEASGRAVLANRSRPHGAALRPAERYAVEALARDAEHALRAVGIYYLDVEKALAPPDATLADDTDAGSQLYGTSALGMEAVIRRKGDKWIVTAGSTIRAHVVGSVSRTPTEDREALLQSGALRRTNDPAIYRLEEPYEVESATAAMLFVTGSSLSPRHWRPVGAPRTRGRRQPDPITRHMKGLASKGLTPRK